MKAPSKSWHKRRDLVSCWLCICSWGQTSDGAHLHPVSHHPLQSCGHISCGLPPAAITANHMAAGQTLEKSTLGAASCLPLLSRWRYLCTGKERKGAYLGSFLAVSLESTAFWTVLNARYSWDVVYRHTQSHIYLQVASCWQSFSRWNHILLSEQRCQLKLPFVLWSIWALWVVGSDSLYPSKTGKLLFFDTWLSNSQVEIGQKIGVYNFH